MSDSSSNGGSSASDDADGEQRHKRLRLDMVQRIRNEIECTGDVTFEDIAGLKKQLKEIEQDVIWPLKQPKLFNTGGRSPPKGLLLFGPPGTGKTMIGKAIANEASATFFALSPSSFAGTWCGEGAMLVRCLFEVARAETHSVIFIDEIDSLMAMSDEIEDTDPRWMKAELRISWDGLESDEKVILIGTTTTCPDNLNSVARRRFSTQIYIPLPDAEGRKELIVKLLKKANHNSSLNNVEALAKVTNGFSGADLNTLCRDAAAAPLRKLIRGAMAVKVEAVLPIVLQHLRKSFKNMKPIVSPDDLVRYETWNRQNGYNTSDDEDDEVYSDDDDDDNNAP